MENKKLITKLKNNAELAQAAYGYFHLVGKKFPNNKKKYGDKANEPVTLEDILDSTYKGYKIYAPPLPSLPNLKPEKIGTLNGDFTPTQAKNFANKVKIKQCRF